MIILLIVIITIILILAILFASWFLTMKANGKCPICALKKLSKPTEITINIDDVEDYNNAVKTPPMGWSSWNTFRNHIDQELIMEVAVAMKNSGLADAGYKYLNIDDCWQSSFRDFDGKLQGDLGTFNQGIPKLIKAVNSLGLKVGLYSSNGTHTCEDLPASLGNEELDAKTLASWGCEYFKYDFCHCKSLSGNCPAVEAVEINKVNDFVKTKILPDDMQTTGRAKIINVKELPLGKAMAYLNHGAGTASFTFDACESGEYVLTVTYYKTLSKKNEYMQVVVNSKTYELFFPTSKGWSSEARIQTKVYFNKGENKITLQNPIVTPADSSYTQYKRMGDALKEATKKWAKVTDTDEKPITYSICEWGTAKPYMWGAKAGNLWRTTLDIFPNWKSIYLIYKHTISLFEHTKPGAYNDPDMLEVGNGKLSEEENKSHFALWCMMCAPLILGNDVRQFVDGSGNAVKNNTVLKIVTNKQLISIDQDALGKSAKIIKKTKGVHILSKPLSNGDAALCLFNTTKRSKHITYNLRDLSNDDYSQLGESSNYEYHELYENSRENGTQITVTIPAHGVKVYRIKTV